MVKRRSIRMLVDASRETSEMLGQDRNIALNDVRRIVSELGITETNHQLNLTAGLSQQDRNVFHTRTYKVDSRGKQK